ncbi:MAG: ribosome maturation factor RimM [Chloroherpetonaceae bacterium]|nr:ribosome maturation factor RimM [Chloroherpetonaceae bacterium]
MSRQKRRRNFRGYSLFIDETQLVRLGKNQAYIHELIGLQAVDTQGKLIGVLTDVLTLPSCDAYQIRYGEREVLIPALAEFVEEVDLSAKLVRLKRFEEFL